MLNTATHKRWPELLLNSCFRSFLFSRPQYVPKQPPQFISQKFQKKTAPEGGSQKFLQKTPQFFRLIPSGTFRHPSHSSLLHPPSKRSLLMSPIPRRGPPPIWGSSADPALRLLHRVGHGVRPGATQHLATRRRRGRARGRQGALVCFTGGSFLHHLHSMVVLPAVTRRGAERTEDRGALVTSTHWMGLKTTPSCDSWYPYKFKQVSAPAPFGESRICPYLS